jgi:hypothetical protein
MPDTLPALPKLHVREYPEVVKRGHLTPKQKAALREIQDERCAGCGLKPKRWEYDHKNPLWGGGQQSDLSDWQALGARGECDCHQAKTSAEAAERARMKRLRGVTGQRARRQKRGGSSIKGRGFQKPPPNFVSPLSKKARRERMRND